MKPTLELFVTCNISSLRSHSWTTKMRFSTMLLLVLTLGRSDALFNNKKKKEEEKAKQKQASDDVELGFAGIRQVCTANNKLPILLH